MSRALTVLFVSLCVSVFTFGCTTEGGAPAAGGEGGAAGEGGVGGEGGAAGIRSDFATSLHKTRVGKETWYLASNNGYEALTAVPYDNLPCKNCHDANAFPEWKEATCADCHEAPGSGGADGGGPLDPATCLGCHAGRQGAEADQFEDVHVDSTNALLQKGCASCHGKIEAQDGTLIADNTTDVHGDGNTYDTMLRPGAISADCVDCHTGALAPPDNSFHSATHVAAMDCSVCHSESVITCHNCHFDAEADEKGKCWNSGRELTTNWKFLVMWDKEGNDQPIYTTATVMSLKYNCERTARPGIPDCPDGAGGSGGSGGANGDPIRTFAVFAPYHGHTITQKAQDDITNSPAGPAPYDEPGCGYCHGLLGLGDTTLRCDDINSADMNDPLKLIAFVEDGAGGTGGAATGSLDQQVSGLIPLPPDYKKRFALDFAEFQDGPETMCPPKGDSKPLVLIEEDGPDRWQTGADTNVDDKDELGRPLTEAEMKKFCPDFTELP